MSFSFDPQRDALHDWLEQRASGQMSALEPPADPDLAKLQETANRLDQLARRYDEAVLHTRSSRRTTWEDRMTTSTGFTVPAVAPASSNPARSWPHRVRRWQPFLSFGVVVMLLLGLVGITYTRVGDSTSDANQPGSGANSMLPSDATPGVSGTTCVPREVTWQEPEKPLAEDRVYRYVAIERASAEIGTKALETWAGYMGCYSPDPYQPGEDLTEFHTMAEAYMTTNAAAVEEWGGLRLLSAQDPLGAEFVASAPVILNQPVPPYRYPGTNQYIDAFLPADVYRFFDGRYGVVIGSVSTQSLLSGPDDTELGSVWFVSFIEQNGQLFIDELDWVCLGPTGWVPVESDGRTWVPTEDGATPVSTSTYSCQ